MKANTTPPAKRLKLDDVDLRCFLGLFKPVWVMVLSYLPAPALAQVQRSCRYFWKLCQSALPVPYKFPATCDSVRRTNCKERYHENRIKVFCDWRFCPDKAVLQERFTALLARFPMRKMRGEAMRNREGEEVGQKWMCHQREEFGVCGLCHYQSVAWVTLTPPFISPFFTHYSTGMLLYSWPSKSVESMRKTDTTLTGILYDCTPGAKPHPEDIEGQVFTNSPHIRVCLLCAVCPKCVGNTHILCV